MNNTDEKLSARNLGIGNLNVIDGMKAAVERACPGVVSCSGLIVLAARDAVRPEGCSPEEDNETQTQLSQNDEDGNPISGSRKKKEEGEEGGDERHWPPEVLQLIFSRLPFPSLQKLQGISKYWNHLFSSALLSATLEGKAFQTDFLSVSSRWPQFCPVYISSQPNYHSIWGFNQSTRSWEEIHTHIPRSFPDPNRVGQMQQTILFGQLSGALVCLVQRTVIQNRLYSYNKQLLEVMVLNIFTGDYTVMPPLTEAEVSGDPELISTIFDFFPDLEQIQWGTRSPDDFIFAYDQESGSYNVYLMYESTCAEENRRLEFFQNEENLRGILIFQYLSATCTWTACLTRGQRNSDRFETSLATGSTSYLDGVIYTMSLEPMRVWAYDLDDAIETDVFGDDDFRSDPLNLKTESLRAWGIVEVYNLLMVAVVIENVAYIHELVVDTMDWMLISASSTDIGERERKRKRKEGSSYLTEEDNEEERKWNGKKQRDDPSQASGDQSSGQKSTRHTWRRNGNWGGQKSKRPHYQVVSDSRCIYFCPSYTSEEPILVYTVLDREWSTIRFPKMMKRSSELKLLAGCARPGDDPFTPVYTL
ncbi:hypothetical protein R1sor_011350 [Riccia sorocarpa]|uniref:Plant heme peroxidase family profile domain-containing protein n=1 Tax=Riccia sorocarpa TaxID=122646 RepID=A0ABD3I430_9MARC